MRRYLESYLLRDISKKIILLSGPRQTGKTTLAKMLIHPYEYLNFDASEHRLLLKEKSWDRKKRLIIFDELHKMKNWKRWLKGIYDTEGVPPSILVTGSARLDVARKVGDSLAGRYFQFRLHPLDLEEIVNILKPKNREAALEKLLEMGGFPEPFLKGSKAYYQRWKKTHLDIILRQDLIMLETIKDLASIETLVQLLRNRVGNPISYKSLSEDLDISDKTVKRWLQILENLYIIFKITPYHKNIARALKKAPKYYFYDTGQVIGDEGIKLENLLACALIKKIHFLEDCIGKTFNLFYLREKNGPEIDFFMIQENGFSYFIECKWKEEQKSKHFFHFEKILKNQYKKIKKIQVVKELKREKTFPDGTEIRKASQWLSELDIH